MLYELVTGLPPFYSRNTNEIYESILNEDLSFPSQIELSDEIKDLLLGLLCKEPNDRLGVMGGVAELLTHPWFKNVNLVKFVEKSYRPPFKPNPIKLNFEQNNAELTKGELETREKLLGRTGLQQEVKLFNQFYFDVNEQKQLKSEQKKIFMAHKMFVMEQQQVLDRKYKQKQAKSSEKFKTQNGSRK